MERTVLKCSLGLILNNFYKKSWSRNRPLKSLIQAHDDDNIWGFRSDTEERWWHPTRPQSDRKQNTTILILILPCGLLLRLPSGVLPQVSRPNLCAVLSTLLCVIRGPTHLILTTPILDKETKLWTSSVRKFNHPPNFFSFRSIYRMFLEYRAQP
jgi:hypothetical protein